MAKNEGIKFALLAFLALSMVVSTSAGLSVSGAAYIGEVSPGEVIVHEMTVSIDEDASPQNMTAELYGFAMNERASNVELSPEEDTGPYSARPFLSVEPKSFTVEPGVPQKVLLTGTVPDDVGAGGRYALVTIKTVPDGEGDVSVSSAIQVLILLTIKDSKLIKTGEISDLATSMSGDEVSVDLLFENTGNVLYKPLVGAILKGEDGETVAEVEATQIPTSILPTGSRLVSMTLVPDAVLEPGTYTVEATVALDDGTVLDTAETTIEV